MQEHEVSEFSHVPKIMDVGKRDRLRFRLLHVVREMIVETGGSLTPVAWKPWLLLCLDAQIMIQAVYTSSRAEISGSKADRVLITEAQPGTLISDPARSICPTGLFRITRMGYTGKKSYPK